MKKQFKMSQVTLAVALLSTGAIAFAQGPGGHSGHGDHDGASITKSITVTKDVTYEGKVKVNGEITADSLGMAVIKDEQASMMNNGTNAWLTNDASVQDNALQNASGNIGVNTASGDGNIQDNSAALAAADARAVFGGEGDSQQIGGNTGGSGDAEIFVTQMSGMNSVTNTGTQNSATIQNNALQNAVGNIGVNIASGNGNMQKNNLAVAYTEGQMSEATVFNKQGSMGNITNNTYFKETVTDSGEFGGNIEMTGTYDGQSDQIGDVYPDIWSPANHGEPPYSDTREGHFDLDRSTEGGTDLNEDGGALAFNEAGTIALSGSFSGGWSNTNTIYQSTVNNATVQDNAMQNAVGNIGLNVASGSNNMQSNSLAVSYAASTPIPPLPVNQNPNINPN